MDTMSYSQMLLTVDLISKWVLLAFGGMELNIGLLGKIVIKDSQLEYDCLKGGDNPLLLLMIIL